MDLNFDDDNEEDDENVDDVLSSLKAKISSSAVVEEEDSESDDDGKSDRNLGNIETNTNKGNGEKSILSLSVKDLLGETKSILPKSSFLREIDEKKQILPAFSNEEIKIAPEKTTKKILLTNDDTPKITSTNQELKKIISSSSSSSSSGKKEKAREIEKESAKEKVKRQRMQGQSGVGSDFKTWRTEEEMAQRQQYD